jgi:hypothetical protein
MYQKNPISADNFRKQPRAGSLPAKRKVMYNSDHNLGTSDLIFSVEVIFTSN